MQEKNLASQIINEANNEVKLINDETNRLNKELLNNELSKIKGHLKSLKLNQNNLATSTINTLKNKLDKEVIAYDRKVKFEIVQTIYDDVFNKIRKLEEKELLNLIKTIIDHDEIIGTETIIVSKDNYNKYLKAFSSKSDPNNLDLINNINNKYNFQLRSAKLNFKDGFILENNEFDLIFNFNNIVNNHHKENQKRLYKELFDNDW